MNEKPTNGRYKAFMALTYTLCFILIATTAMLVAGKILVEVYERVLMILGVPTIIGMVFNAYFHNKTRPEDENGGINEKDSTVSSTFTDANGGKS